MRSCLACFTKLLSFSLRANESALQTNPCGSFYVLTKRGRGSSPTRQCLPDLHMNNKERLTGNSFSTT